MLNLIVTATAGARLSSLGPDISTTLIPFTFCTAVSSLYSLPVSTLHTILRSSRLNSPVRERDAASAPQVEPPFLEQLVLTRRCPLRRTRRTPLHELTHSLSRRQPRRRGRRPRRARTASASRAPRAQGHTAKVEDAITQRTARYKIDLSNDADAALLLLLCARPAARVYEHLLAVRADHAQPSEGRQTWGERDARAARHHHVWRCWLG